MIAGPPPPLSSASGKRRGGHRGLDRACWCGGDVGAVGTCVGVSPLLLLTKEAGSIGGRAVRCASKEADRGACEKKYKVGTKMCI